MKSRVFTFLLGAVALVFLTGANIHSSGQCGRSASCSIGDTTVRDFSVITAGGTAIHDGPDSIIQIGSGAFPTVACTVGEIFLDTDQTVDTNCTTTSDNSLCLCTATDTWVELDNN